MNHAQVAHRWAQRDPNKLHGTGSRMFFDGPDIFSHGRHWLIARFTKNKRGQTAVLVNGDGRGHGRSPSTGQHTRHVINALHGGPQPYFLVAYPEAGGQYSSRSHVDNLRRMLRDAAEYVGKAKRARTYGESYRARAGEQFDHARAYARFFGISRNLPKNLDRIEEALEADRKRDAAAQAKRAEAKRADDLKDFRLWLAGADTHNYCPSSYQVDEQGSAYLRLRGDVVQTSRGAEVPRDHAERAVRFVLAVRERGQDWHRNGEELRVGHFSAESIKANGDTRIGCHYFTFQRIAELATALGIPFNIFMDKQSREARAQRDANIRELQAKREAMPRTAHDCLPGEGV